MRAGSELPAAAQVCARSDLQSDSSGLWAGLLRLRTGARTTPSGGRPDRPLYYCRSETGRRTSCMRVLERLFGARPARLHHLFLARAPVVFLMVEEAFLLYVAVGLFRMLIGRRTAGLLLRPIPLAVSQRWPCRWRRAVLARLKGCRAVRTLTVLPFSVFPAFAGIADGWIYDPQFWDLTEEQRRAVALLRHERRPGERSVLTAIGTQGALKGLDRFADIYARCLPLRARFQFIACGKILPPVAEHAAVLAEAGGVVVDRRMSEAELLGAYAASDAVWCVYPKTGDHACGILGRAVQLGIPVVVRHGSLGHRLCIVENLPHVAVAAESEAERLASPLPRLDEVRGRRAADAFARQSETTLRAALGLAAARAPAEV